MSNMLYNSELFHKTYDSTLEADLSMYDKMPYERDPDMCNESNIAMVSGNIIKNYDSHLIYEAFRVGGENQQNELHQNK